MNLDGFSLDPDILMNSSNTADCSIDPYDLRPAANLIVAAIKCQYDALSPGEKLVIPFGEDHQIMSHRVLQQMVVSRLEKELEEKILFAYEQPHNRGVQLLQEHRGISITPEEFSKSDPEGKKLLELFIAHGKPTMGSISLFFFLTECLKLNNTVFAATDMARYGDRIDQSDASTASFFTLDDLKESQSPFDTKGMKLRNQHMVSKALELADNSDIRIIIQHCGNNHVVGERSHSRPFEDSLISMWENAGAMVVPVFLETNGECNTLNSSAKNRLQTRGIMIKGMTEEDGLSCLKRIMHHSGLDMNSYDSFLARLDKPYRGVSVANPDAVNLKEPITKFSQFLNKFFSPPL